MLIDIGVFGVVVADPNCWPSKPVKPLLLFVFIRDREFHLTPQPLLVGAEAAQPTQDIVEYCVGACIVVGLQVEHSGEVGVVA